MSYIYNLILKGVKQAIVGKKVEEIQKQQFEKTLININNYDRIIM